VVPEARTRKLGERLLQAFLAEAGARGAPRVVLHTATANTTAQALFARCGFRTTMLEMTCELEAAPASTPPTLE
jgi:ribosomal protein S18 acetylase RimI-like enzyme